MKQFILTNKKALTSTLAILLVGAITMSFQDFPFADSQSFGQEIYSYEGTSCTDTFPDKESMKMKDFDKLQLQLDKTLGEVDAELKNLDFTKLQMEIESSLKTVDVDKIRKDIDLALKSIDMDKILADVSSSLKNVNPDYNKAGLEKALAEASKDINKAKLELKEIDKDVIKKEMDNATKEIEKGKLEIAKIDMNKIMDEARAGIDKAKAELKLTKEMFTEMEKDGLINSKNGFTIEYKNKDLYIDGVKQSEKTTDKYRKYFKKEDFKITIGKD
ncbi:MAG: hypothetical protein ABI685_03070 [Ferruginibacter sp.]